MMERELMRKLLVPVVGAQGFDALGFVHDLVTAERNAAFQTGQQQRAAEMKAAYEQGLADGRSSMPDDVEADEEGAFKAGWQAGFESGIERDKAAASVFHSGYEQGHLAGWDAAIDAEVNDEYPTEIVYPRHLNH